MTVLRAVRRLLFGETWVLPVGVTVLLAAGLALRAWDPSPWPHAAGPALTAGVLLVLWRALAR